MKILYFLAHPNSIGGAMKVLMKQASIMQQNGYEVLIVIQNNSQNFHIPEYDYLCDINHLKHVSAQYPIATCIENIDICGSMEAYESIKNIVKEFQPDLIHSMQLNITVEYIARELGIPHLMNIYPISDGMFRIKWMDVFPQYQSGDSDFYCRQWREGLGIESRCIRVPYKCNKTDKDSLSDLLTDRMEIINIASFGYHKRQLEIIRFIEKCKNKGFRVHISFLGANKGKYADKCRKYVESHGLNNEVTFEGQVIGIEKYLRKSDLMVHASICESYPGVIVEAMGNCVPVIATPVAGVPELLEDCVNGFLAKGYLADDLYEAFERYIEFKNENRIESIVDRAYDTYLNNHTYEVTFKKLDEYYRYILTNHVKNNNRFAEIRDSFECILQFGKEICIDSYSERTKSFLWYLYHIKKLVDERQYHKAVIWGAGELCTTAIEFCKILSLQIIGIMDKYKNGEKDGIVISKPSGDMINKADVVFLAIADIEACEENSLFIEETGKIRNSNYFLISNNPCIQLSVS
jgi:glycosyltransferase involved in cell wall biosynthesis